MKYFTLLFFFSFFFGSKSIAQSKINYKYYFDFVNKEAAFDSLNLLYPTLQLTEIGELEFLSNFGKMAFYANRLDTCIQLANAGLLKSEKVGSDSLTATFHGLKASVYYILNKLADAKIAYSTALLFAQKAKAKKLEASISNNLGGVYADNNQLDSAEFLLSRSVVLYKSLGKEFDRDDLWSKRILATIYSRQKKYNKAIALFEASLKHSRIVNDSLLISAQLIYLANTYREQGNLSKAFALIEEAVEMQEKGFDKTALISSYSQYSQILEELGDYKKALLIYKKNSKLSAEIYRSELVSKVSEMQVKFDTEKEIEQRHLAEKQLEAANLSSELSKKNFQLIVVALISALSLLVLLFLVYYIKNQKKQVRLNQQIQLERLQAIVEGEEIERKRIAQELHDGVNQLLAALKMNLQAEANLQPYIMDLLNSAIGEIRTISHNLMPAEITTGGFLQALKSMIRKLDGNEKLRISLQSGIEELKMTQQSQTNLYRIVQELIQNTMKHANATEVNLELQEINGMLKFSIADNGVGVSKEKIEKNEGIGWRNIKARLQLLNGSLSIDETLKIGTHINMSIPL